ncbi:carboxypeptidase regulatory-like domain-containing protein [Sphaerospermopsis aphanizomenoides BCCUSP55]|nr:carboxypeptidase regulatory-like domain-containing protein [Sphaerospermopsis aphanizomenoides BCCUSP55]
MEVKTAGIGDFVWEDLNANGIQEANESGIDGATVTLLDGSGNVLGTTISGDNPNTAGVEKGWYQFGPLLPSTYQVRFSLPTGFNTVSPYLQGGNINLDSNANPSNNFTSTPITLVGGQVNKTLDAGFYKYASLGDYVFADNNNNGIQDAGDTALAGVTVELVKNGVTVATTTTNANGGYLFANLIPGDYQVKFTAPTGYAFTTADAGGDDSKDSDANATTGITQTVTLTSGQFNGTLDAGLVALASLGDFVWHDVDADGVQDAGEAGIANATVKLLKNGVEIATATTDSQGKYSFNNLVPGTGYQVQFVTPAGYTQTSPVDAGGNDAIDSDGTLTGVVTLAPGENNPTLDAGFYNLASLGDYVFADNNTNGIQDAGDTALAGVTVELVKNGVTVATTTTNASGGYLFENLIPGDYQVKFTAPTGYAFSTPDQGGNDAADSDANPSTGLTQTVTLTSGELNSTLDAGLIALASLGDFVWHDIDADGIQDANESGIANATVKLLKDGIEIASTTTDADGKYSFTNLIPGTGYQVQFVTPAGYTQTSPVDAGGNDAIDSDGTLTGVVTLAPGENNPTLDAGFYNLASLGDYVFADNNTNGIQDAGDTALAGVTVELVKNGVTVATTTTNTSGGYLFENLIPGDYQVQFTAPTGYVFTTADAGGDDSKDSDANATGLTQTVTLTSGELNSTLDAGLVALASLGDFVFEDRNANGIQDAGEAGIANATVRLLDTNGNIIATTTTDSNGLYSFNNLLPGDYKVQFVQPNDFNSVSPTNAGSNDAVDSDADVNLTTGVINLSPGENDTTVDAGFYNTAALGDFVFVDANNNGIQDAGEAGLSGVKVELINPADGSVITSITTDANGGYNFSGLTPGDYQVRFTAPTGYSFSTANQGGDDAKDSDANITTGLTQTVTLTSGEFNSTLDAGLVPLASLGNFVFEDKNANGIQDAGETGIANATVNLLDANGNFITSTTTNGSGQYSFNNLQPGDYKVQFVQPTGFNGVSLANQGGDDSLDSDGLVSDVVTLSPGENNTTIDSGFYKTASLGDFVFKDTNNNGIQNAGEAGFSGVTVELINPVDESVIASTTTDANGGYNFSGLTPGDYQVRFTAPTGYSFTASNQGADDAKDSDANPSTGVTQTVTLTSGEFNGTLDAGLVQLASLGNFVFEDKNANGIQDEGETGIANATVQLLKASGTVIKTTTTDADGLYSFTNLQPGDYKVQFVQPTGFDGVSPANQGGDDAVDSDGLISDFVNLSPGENDTTVDSGFYKTASLGDFVFVDANNNGIQDAGEAGLGGVTVELINPADGSVITSTTTDANGGYSFSGLTPGDYQVKFSAPTGYGFSTPDQGEDDAKDSDADSTGVTQTVTLTSGEFNGTLDAGLVQLASLGNFVFEDKNANGIQDVGETGIAGASVNLLDANGNFITSTTTNGNGQYSFTNLQPGDYKVQFVQPTGFDGVSPANVGTNDAIDSDGLVSDVVTLSPGENDTTVDSGFYKTASLGDFVFVDANNNGIQDAGETGLGGVTVELINPADGSVITSTTTDANGGYSFSGLTPGDYQVQFTAPTGYSFSTPDQGGDDALDSDADSTGKTQTVTLTSGEFNGTLDAGLVQLARLGNFVFEDKNANGIQDAGETGIGNATINLLDANGNFITSTTTNGSGQYSFTNLQPGDYKVQFVEPTGFDGVSPANVGGDDSVDSDGLVSDVVNLSPGENDTTVDSGFYKTASLGDKVWLDSNLNGIQDAGEAGLGGVTVTLTGGGADGIINGVGDTTITTTTNASGNYNFTNLTPGQQYQVTFDRPAGYNFTQKDVNGNSQDTVDSDADLTTGKSQIVTLSSGENNTTIDAGIYQSASDLSITKTDGLTTVTPGQQITYTIVATNNGLVTATNALVSDIMPTNLTNVTWTSVASGGATGNDLTGTGNINDTVTLTAGSSITYTVTGTVAPITTTLGSAATFDLSGNNNTVSYGNTNTFTNNGITMTASAFSRVDGTNGAWETASLNRYSGGAGVIDRSEGNGDNNRHTVDNVGGRDNYVLFQFSESVVLDKAYLGYVVGDSDLSVWIGNFSSPLTTLSDSILNSFGFIEVNDTTSGSVRWADVNAGNYAGNTIVIAASTADTTPDDYFKIDTLNVNKIVQSSSSLTNTATITAPTGFTDTNLSNNTATDTDTIGSPTVKIGDRVWYDTNGNGVQDSGELGVSGVTVNLLNQAGTQISTTTTDANGLYQFTANANSTYSVKFVQPTGFNGFTTANIGNDGTDSDVVDAATGKTATFTVGTTDNLTIDAGLIKNIVDLSITKTDGLTTVNPGQQITYTIVATNNGPMTATNALVSDIMPTNLTNVTWTSVASGGATGNDLTGTGNINDTVTLASGSSITYTVKGTVAPITTTLGSAATFDLSGNNNTVSYGNTNTFTNNGITMTASAFSRVDGTNGAWETASLNRYSGGAGVIDRSEGNGDNNRHTVDNVGGRDNYVLFQFSESVVLDKAYLGYVVGDSDLSVWIGNFSSPLTTLSDSILNSFGFTEVNDTTSGSVRWADVNAGNYAGNTIVIAASTADTTPDDYFKIDTLNVNKIVQSTSSLTNTATITAPTGFTDTNLSNNTATDTDTVSATPTLPNAPGVRTPGFWSNCDWQKFWDGIQGNEPSQKTEANFADSDLLFAPYTNSAQPGKVLDPVNGSYDIGLLIGDYNRNGKTDTGENTIFYTLNQARQIVDSSQHPNGDKRFDLGRSLVASWLNYLAGNPIDTANTTDKDARYYISEGINWLQAITPDENADKKGDGAIYQLTGSNVSSPTVDTYWSQGISSASSLPSPYTSNTNVLYSIDSGSVINTNLDNYNNGLGLADNVYYGG